MEKISNATYITLNQGSVIVLWHFMHLPFVLEAPFNTMKHDFKREERDMYS